MIESLSLVIVLALGAPGAKDDMLTFRGPGFTLQYPEDDTKLDPPSARVPFQLEYRKNSLVRLETERLTQPIDLGDDTFAAIFLEVQLERLKERVTVPLSSSTIKRYPWGPGIEFVYYVPARSGKRKERDLVTEVVTTVDETLYRFTTWIPEKDVRRSAAPVAGVLASFRPERPPETTAADDVPPSGRFSRAALEEKVREHRQAVEASKDGGPALAEAEAALAETLGLKAYLWGAAPAEIDELSRAAETAVRLAADDADSRQARAWAAYHRSEMVEMERAVQEALTLDAGDPESHLLYALWYGFNPERSKEMADEALRADSDLAPAHYVKAVAARRLGDVAEARGALERALAIEPSLTRARRELAEILDESGETEAALAAYRTLSLTETSDVSVHFRLAVLARRAGLVDEAVTTYQKALSLDPTLSEAHYNLAVLYLREKNLPALAAQSFQRFLELDPESDRADTVRKWLRDNGY